MPAREIVQRARVALALAVSERPVSPRFGGVGGAVGGTVDRLMDGGCWASARQSTAAL